MRSDLKEFNVKKTGLSGKIICKVPKNPLTVGSYRISIGVLKDNEHIDRIDGAIFFNVIDTIYFGSSKAPDKNYCALYVDHDWSMEVLND